MMFCADTITTDPVQRLAAHMAARIAMAGGAYQALAPCHVRELAHAVAWNWVEETGRPDASPAEWLPRVSRALTACGAPDTGALMMLFDTQLVRPAKWVFHGGRPFLILDCARLAPRETEKMALIMDRGLTIILDRMAPLWDSAAGAGALGLRRGGHLAATLQEAAAGKTRRRKEQPLQGLRRRCADRLAVLARQRGWTRCPDVILLK